MILIIILTKGVAVETVDIKAVRMLKPMPGRWRTTCNRPTV